MNIAHHLFVNGATLEYYTAGPGDGPLVITLHGGRGFGSKDSDFSVYSELAKNGYHVVSFDFRGHNRSSFTPPFTFSQLVDDIDGVRAHFAGLDGKCIVIGGSFGGFLAQQYAITYKEHVSFLVLRGTACSHHHEAAAMEKLRERLDTVPNASVDMLKKVFGRFESDEEMRLVMFALGPLYSEKYDANKGLASCLGTIYRAESHNQLYSEEEKYFDYSEGLRELDVPTLIIVGENDWICPVAESLRMAQLIRGSELLVVPGANHGVHLEKREVVLEGVLRFLGVASD